MWDIVWVSQRPVSVSRHFLLQPRYEWNTDIWQTAQFTETKFFKENLLDSQEFSLEGSRTYAFETFQY